MHPLYLHPQVYLFSLPPCHLPSFSWLAILLLCVLVQQACINWSRRKLMVCRKEATIIPQMTQWFALQLPGFGVLPALSYSALCGKQSDSIIVSWPQGLNVTHKRLGWIRSGTSLFAVLALPEQAIRKLLIKFVNNMHL